ncbi:anti-sigma-I factor RsgI family protein [Paenibacillus sp. YIM B09110]|uniref:anti-sigma-I factor RsgI family protein n=1 Tax=Paenibacillus sp. YIM B09110 TaxID=3126102 RepID=UPI00301C4C40
MKRGIVMSMTDKYAVVMTADGGFLRAPIQGTPQIGEEIIFEQEYSEARRRPRLRSVYGYSGAAAIALILFLPLLFMMVKDANPIVAYVSMDINPSIEIGVDSHDRVRSLHALNEDGEKIIRGLTYKGVAVELVAASLFEKARESHYLDVADKDIVITSMVMKGGQDGSNDYDQLLSGKISDTLIERLTELAAESITANVTTLAIPSELRDEAAANGVSSGKMAVYLMAKDEGYQIELEQLKKQSIDSVTASIGGVKTIVDNASDTSKSKLKELVDREKAEKIKKNDNEKNSQKPASTPKPAKTAKPNGTSKPAVTNKEDKKQGSQGNGGRKPTATPNNGKKPTSTDKSSSGKNDDKNRGDKGWGDKDDNNDDNRGSRDNDNNDDRGHSSGRGNNDNVDWDNDWDDDRNDDRSNDRDNNEGNRGGQGRNEDRDNSRGGGSQSGRNSNGDRRH